MASTKILFDCIDQKLIANEIPVISSGGVNSTTIEVNFSTEWDGLGKSAVFHTDKYKTVYEVPIVNNSCKIPPEVLEEPAFLFVGVRGVNSDTNEVKPSSMVKFKVVNGAPVGNGTTVEPTLNVYQQLLSAYGKTDTAIAKEAAERKSEVAVERARIDAFVALENGSTTGDAELQDIRIGADGLTYDSAGTAVRKQIDELYKELELDEIFHDVIRNEIAEMETVPLTWNPNKFWDISTGVAVLTDYTGYYYASDEIAVNAGERFSITGNQGSSAKQRLYVITDENYNVLLMTKVSGTSEFEDFKFTIPVNGKKLLFTRHSGTSESYVLKREKYKNFSTQNDLKGLNVSVIGDSISALNGYIPEENDPYYGTGMGEYKNMWWGQFCDKLNANPLIVEAWSGSTVTKGIVESKMESSNDGRCKNLHAYVKATAADYDEILTEENINSFRFSPFYERPVVGDYVKRINPEIVIVAMGVNDYSYNSPIGTWDGSSKLDLTFTKDFRSAYANMLIKIHETYPNALVYCLSPFFVKRITSDSWDVNRNALGLTYVDYENAIKEISDLLQCKFVDVNNLGFNRYNYYDAFCEDNEEFPTHPNKLGQKIIGQSVAEIVRPTINAYVKWLQGKLE